MTPKKTSATAGMTLVEVMVACAVMGVLVAGMMSFSQILTKQQTQSNITFQADTTRRNLMALLNGQNSWRNIRSAVANDRNHGSYLDCLDPNNSKPCTDSGADKSAGGHALTNVPIHVVLDGSTNTNADGDKGNIYYDTRDPTAGFTMQGAPCKGFVAPPAPGNDACPLRYDVTWSAFCGASCINPQVQIIPQATYNPGSPAKTIAFNAANYSKPFFQGQEGMTGCDWIYNSAGQLYENCASGVGINNNNPSEQFESWTVGNGRWAGKFANSSGSSAGLFTNGGVFGYTHVGGPTSIGVLGYADNGGVGGYFTSPGGGVAVVTGDGNVGIGIANPAAKLQVNGSILPGSAGVSIGGGCGPEGSIGYDAGAHAPAYCNNTGHWTAIGAETQGTWCGLAPMSMPWPWSMSINGAYGAHALCKGMDPASGCPAGYRRMGFCFEGDNYHNCNFFYVCVFG